MSLKLIIVGGVAAQIEKYREQAMNAGIIERCHFTGTVSQARANAYIQMADALLSPRTDGTNTPLKVYQQLASGIPLIATKIYSHTQVLSDDVAFLSEPNVESFSAAMLSASSNVEEAKEKAENAVALYEREYSRESYVRKLRKLLDGLR